MDGEPAAEIKYLHLSSRLNRLRYFSYSIGVSWVSMPVHLVSTYFTLHHAKLTGGVLSLAAALFFIPIHFTFMIRRLHDLDRSGWWSLVYGTLLPCFFLVGLGIRTPTFIGALLLLLLVNLGFLLVLLFSPGTQGDNRFGQMPPPNSGLVVAGAWSALALILLAFFGEVAVLASTLGTPSASRGNYAVTIARMGAEQARLYQEENHEWPTDLGNVYGGDLTQGRPYRISTIKYPDGSYGIVVRSTTDIIGRGVEVWTTDAGKDWHCGPAYANPMPKESLPDNCQEDSPAIP